MEKITNGYVPANMPGTPVMNNSIYNNKIIGWWNDDCLIRYPKLLVSAYHALRAKENLKVSNLYEYFSIDKDTFIIMDSGGFTMSTLGEIDIKPQQVIDLAVEFNASIMMSLDIPPYNLLDENRSFNLPDEEFNKKMETSYNNAKYMEENRGNFKGKYYVCIHGDSIERLNIWWNKMNNIKCEGYALAPKDKGDYWGLAQTLLWIYGKGIRENIHFLAFSGINTIPILVYFSKFINNLTFDSSSWAGGAIRREYCIDGIRQKIIYGDSTKYNIKIPCDCKLCSQISKMEDFHNKNCGGALMSLHNLIQYENYIRTMYALRDEPELFKEYIKINNGDKVLKVIEYIDFAIQNGFDKAQVKYKDYLDDLSINYNKKQKNVMEFF